MALKNYFKKAVWLIGLTPTIFFGQVGIETTSPKGALDIGSTTQGVVYPTVALTDTNTQTITNPKTGSIVAGTTVYNTATTSSGSNSVYPGLYIWNGSRWVPQFHKKDNKICLQNSDLRTASTSGDQSVSFDSSSFTPVYNGEYKVTLTVHYGGGDLDAPSAPQYCNFNSEEGVFDFTFNGTTHTFTLKSYSGINDDRLFDDGTTKEYTNIYTQTVYSFVENLTASTLYNFGLTFNQETANGFVSNGDNDGRGYIKISNNLKCIVEFNYIGD